MTTPLQNPLRVRRALLSVSDKSGLVGLAEGLSALGVELISTGGTYRSLKKAGVSTREVAEITHFPEIMDGRVKTLHPKIHGGILGRRDIDACVMEEHEIPPIDLVVVNLYPFEKTISHHQATYESAIENIDIGGPAMVRAAAKNHDHVAVIVDPSDYRAILEAIQTGTIDNHFRRHLAIKAFAHTAHYDAMVAGYLSSLKDDGKSEDFPGVLGLQFHLKQIMRYGENPHQRAAFYVESLPPVGSISAAEQLQGKTLSYNNIVDGDAALECVKSFTEPACVIVKHANPCGVAIRQDGIDHAYDLAFATDPTSAFGGIIAFNRELKGSTIRRILERQFVEVIIAPSVSDNARELASRKKNVRLLACGSLSKPTVNRREYKCVLGGLLVQDRDDPSFSDQELRVVTNRLPTPAEEADLKFAWMVAKFVKSNAIVYAKNGQTIGIGAGQMSRVYSARVAAIKAKDAGLEVQGSVMASDAFFPFRDGIDAAAEAGITAVIQPGGSMRDEEVIDAADSAGIAMVFTGIRHFRH